MAAENPSFKIRYVNAKIEEFVSTIQEGEYDLVLALSVLHNMSKYLGVKFVQDIMLELSKKIHNGIFEFALEPCHYSYIPKNYRDFLPGFDAIRFLSYSKSRDNHYGVPRPMCFASNEYLYFEELGMLKIDQISYNQHSYLAKTDLIHYYCGDKFVKFFHIKDQAQLTKAIDEINFLKTFGGERGLPKLYAIHTEKDETGIRLFIVRDKIEGTVLSEVIQSGKNFDRWEVIKQALEWMVFFEERGYWNGDIQTPNFILSDSGKLYPIDYEEIRRVPMVMIWPYKVNMLFFIFMNAVLNPSNLPFGFHRECRLLTELKKYIPPKKYAQILQIKDSEKYFARMYKILFETEDKEIAEDYNLADLEILAIEKYLIEVGQRLQAVQKDSERLNKLSVIVLQQQKRIEQLENVIREKLL